jgi:hypothetical protein
MLVVELNLNSNSGTFYVNPTGLSTGLAPSGAVYSNTFTYNTITSITGLGLRGNDSSNFDEIRIGTSWADVSPTAIPEPSACAALAGAAILGFISTRRRRT